ncbi:MAG: hypothetical protein ACT4P5_15315 [Armatimonadota bacterium]
MGIDDRVVASLRGKLFLWFLSLGFYVAILMTPINPSTIRERPDNLIIVPNAKLASAIITNLDRPAKGGLGAG